MIEALFPPDEVAVVEGEAEVATALLSLPMDHVYFTGSPDIGKRVMAAAARHLTPVTLELGGKSPTVVDESALVEDAARKIVWGKCVNAGQACVSPDYVLVQRSVRERFIQAARTAARQMYDSQGSGFRQSPDLCRIISTRHFRRLKTLLDDALARGAKIELGGESDADDLYLSPTILSGVTADMKIMQEEIFGPILPVMEYDTSEEAVRQITEREKPLAMYVFSRDRRNIDYLLTRTSAGSTVINHNMIQAGVNSHLPFGGVKNSGTGRSIGRATFEGFSNPRSVVEQPTGWRDFSWLSLPPYSKLYQRMLHWMFR
jgi:aldehyde dehydrogenase (NAD+)